MKLNAFFRKGQEESGPIYYIFWCPGCDEPHAFRTLCKDGRPNWTFNGNIDKPSFTPSLLYPSKPRRCHLYLTDGILIFLSDCEHSLAGQRVPMIPYPYLDD